MSALLPHDIYRYVLRRRIGDLLVGARGVLLWIMWNPSTALTIAESGRDDDHTIRKVLEFTHLWGFSSLVVVNLFAYRTTDQRKLWSQLDQGIDIVGVENDATILAEAAAADAVCCAWGSVVKARAHDFGLNRAQHVLEMLWQTKHKELLCVGRNSNGDPQHPLMAAYIDRPRIWRVRGEK